MPSAAAATAAPGASSTARSRSATALSCSPRFIADRPSASSAAGSAPTHKRNAPWLIRKRRPKLKGKLVKAGLMPARAGARLGRGGRPHVVPPSAAHRDEELRGVEVALRGRPQIAEASLAVEALGIEDLD